MKLRLVLTALAVLAATILPTAASAGQDHDHGRGTFLSLPPDLTTAYLQGHKPHRKFRMYGTWHLLFGPEGLQYEKYFRDKTSIWDGTIADIEPKICEFLTPRAG
jgi:hypothetical protein